MAISPETLKLTADLRATLGSIEDDTTRNLAKAWATSWDSIGPLVLDGVNDMLADVEAGKALTRAQLARNTRLLRALDVAQGELGRLARVANLDIAKDVTEAATQAANAQGRLIASQLPATEGTTAELGANFDKLNPRQLVAITQRVSGQVTSLLHPLSQASYQAMTRSLLTGVTLGSNPREIAARMVRGVEGGFSGGLTRALTIATTEVNDSARAAAREAHMANADVLSGWLWHCACDRRSCPACWSRHGSKHPLDEPGPNDHQRGRCARVPLTKTWADLGFSVKEPPSVLTDGQAAFRALPKADQLAIMGRGRLAALDSGKASWADLAQRRTTQGWRDSYGVRPVKDLLGGHRKAADAPIPVSSPAPGVNRLPVGSVPEPKRPTVPSDDALPGKFTFTDAGDGDFEIHDGSDPVGAVVSTDGGPPYKAHGRYGARIGGDFATAEQAGMAVVETTGYVPSLARSIASGVQGERNIAAGQIATTSRVTFNDGTKAIRKISADRESFFSPGRISETAKDQTDAEVLSAKVLQAFGVRAPSVHRVSDSEIFMEFADGTMATSSRKVMRAKDGDYFSKLAPWVNSDQGIRLGLVDTIMGNWDRNTGNWLVDKTDTIRPIDHGLAWGFTGAVTPEQFGVTLADANPFAAHFGDRQGWFSNPLTPEDAATLRTTLESLRADFDALDRSDWLDHALTRADIIASHATGTERLLFDG